MMPLLSSRFELRTNVSLSYFPVCFTDCKVLDDYIKHYEELHYDSDIVHQTHIRRERSADHILHIPLKAFGRYDKLSCMKAFHEGLPHFVFE